MDHDPVVITLLGKPKGTGRPRFSRKSGIVYTPTQTRNEVATLRLISQQEMNGRLPFDVPVSLEIMAELAIPASWSKRKRARAITGEVKPAGRPDWDNIGKLASDALKGIAYRDDALIVDARVRKRYGVQPKVVITVKPV